MSLLIGRYVGWALQDGAVAEATDGRVFPVTVPQDLENVMPYVTFASNGMEEAGSKDGVEGDTSTVEIEVVARTLDELESVAEMVRQRMAAAWEVWNDREGAPFYVVEQTMRAGAEDFDLMHDGFFVSLFYEIVTE